MRQSYFLATINFILPTNIYIIDMLYTHPSLHYATFSTTLMVLTRQLQITPSLLSKYLANNRSFEHILTLWYANNTARNMTNIMTSCITHNYVQVHRIYTWQRQLKLERINLKKSLHKRKRNCTLKCILVNKYKEIIASGVNAA